ncbi:MAG: hypothetical protein JXL84_15130 [Deltaproteobacteria bacterium]|nr:hypothetical protein [Deltaproteobacteria bacterium]
MAEDKDKDREIAELKAAIAARDRQISELLMAGAPEEEPELTDQEKALVARACKAYGIDEKYVLKARIEEAGGAKAAVVITRGGAKVRFAEGEDPKGITPLDAFMVDGVIRKKMKAVTGGKK